MLTREWFGIEAINAILQTWLTIRDPEEGPLIGRLAREGRLPLARLASAELLWIICDHI
jgi:hypothetical protein